MAYSVALGLKYKYLGNANWEVNEMVEEDLNAGLDDEAMDTRQPLIVHFYKWRH